MNKICCSMYNMADVGDYLWFWAFRENLLCKMKKNTLNVTPIARISMEKKLITDVWGEYREIYSYNDKLVLIPMGHRKLKIIDMNNYETVDVEIPEEEEDGFTQFVAAHVDNDGVLLIPCEKKSIYKLHDSNSKNVTIEPVWSGEGKILSWGGSCFDGRTLSFTSLNDNKIRVINRDGNAEKGLELTGEEALSGVFCDGNKTWVIPRKTNKIYYFENNNKAAKKLSKLPDGYTPGEWSFYKGELIDKRLYLLPRESNMVLIVDTVTYEVSGIDISSLINRNTQIGKYMPISHVWKYNDDVIAIVSETGRIINLTGKDEYSLSIEGEPIIEEMNEFHSMVLKEKSCYYRSLEKFILSVEKM